MRQSCGEERSLTDGEVLMDTNQKPRKLTESQRRALSILAGEAMAPREFAQAMWPESLGHNRMTNCGQKSVTRGGGMNLAGGGYLGKLRKGGLVRPSHEWTYDNRYAITAEGRQALRAV